MIKIAICDDDATCIAATQASIELYCAKRSLEPFSVTTYTDSTVFLDAVERGAVYDIYMLDIYMPAITGMVLAHSIRYLGVNSPIIFLTTSKEHALEAFGVGATHYLVKPFREDDFVLALDKALAELEYNRPKYIVFKSSGELHNIAVGDIVFVESTGNYQKITVRSGGTLLVRQTSEKLFEMLVEHDCFARCGKAYILNLAHIKRLTAKTVLMSTNQEILIPRGVHVGLRDAYFQYYEKA